MASILTDYFAESHLFTPLLVVIPPLMASAADKIAVAELHLPPSILCASPAPIVVARRQMSVHRVVWLVAHSPPSIAHPHRGIPHPIPIDPDADTHVRISIPPPGL